MLDVRTFRSGVREYALHMPRCSQYVGMIRRSDVNSRVVRTVRVGVSDRYLLTDPDSTTEAALLARAVLCRIVRPRNRPDCRHSLRTLAPGRLEGTRRCQRLTSLRVAICACCSSKT